jgi:hypothetical protein
MLDQFEGTATTITGARVRDYRPLAPNAFRFVIEVSDGFAVDGADPAGLASLEPGGYLVTYDNGFTTVPAGSPSISLNLSTRTLEGGDLTAFASAVVQVDAENAGLQDSPDLTLVVDRQRGNEIQEVARQPFPMLSEEPARATLVWPPSEPGPWNLRARLVRPDGQVVTTAGQALDVRQNLRQDSLEAGAFFNAEGRPPLAALPLVVLALMVGWIVRSTLVAARRKGA